MRFLAFATAMLVVSLASAEWDCDERCPGYDECVAQNNNRGLSVKPDLSLLEDQAGWTEEAETKVVVREEPKHLRGSAWKEDTDSHRHLLMTNFTYFHFKMYWEEGYCWQEEWDEKDWCMECSNCKKWGSDNECEEEGGSSTCEAGDYLWTQRCDEDENEQQFLYEPLPEDLYGPDAGRIHPYHAQHLCLERTRVNAHQLKPCSPINNINTTQIVIGFHESGRFELHPFGWDENSTTHVNGPKCLNNHHHPKSGEIVRAEFCNYSRKNKVSRWIVHYPVWVTSGSSGGSEGGGDGDPPVTALGGSYCTPENPCPQCYGDCDDDADCIGSLVCHERDAGDAVPSCSGGEDSDSDTDYCVDPFWTAGSGATPSPVSAPPPTASPTIARTASPTDSPTDSPAETPTDSPTATTEATTVAATTPATTAEATSSATTAAATTPATTVAATTALGSLPQVVPVNGTYCSETNPCPICYGDCDEDIDCAGDLICFQRDAGDAVPGCSGGEESDSDTDYCIVDPNSSSRSDTPAPTTSPVAASTPSPVSISTPVPISYSICSPTQKCDRCVGDCDQDSDCVGNLVCLNRDGGEPIPGCVGTDTSKTDFCVEPW